MNVEVAAPQIARAQQQLAIIDCDIHPALRTPADIWPFLSKRWQKHFDLFGSNSRDPFSDTIAYPRMQPALARADSWPENGPPGSDLNFMRRQHLDANNVEAGILIALGTRGPEQRNVEYSAALCTALNDWQIETWTRPEPRLRGSIVVPQEDTDAAVAEIERRGGDDNFVQVYLSPRNDEPLGRRRYWPIFEAARCTGRPVGIHVGGQGGHAVTGSGWVSYYMEDHHASVQTMEALLTSLVVEGVFQRFPDLKIVMIEAGFGWVPSLTWRLDKQWKRLRSEAPHLKRLPSEYIHEQVWFTTQPIEEPERPEDLLRLMEWIGFDRLMISTDYPHWDFDDPRTSIKVRLTEEQKRKVYRQNAAELYGIYPVG